MIWTAFLYSYVQCVFSVLPASGLTPLSFKAGLYSAVLTAFVVLKIPDLKPNPADQSSFYQNQTVQMLDRISQQFASVDPRNSSNYTPPLPYPTFHISASDRRVNIFWLISLVCSLSAALLATLVQQWVRAYMRVFHQSSNPLKTARIRQYSFEGVTRLPAVAEFVPGLIHISVILFFCGLGDLVFQLDSAVFVTTVVPIGVCVCLYILCVVKSIRNPQSPYRTPFSGVIWFLIQKLRHRSQYSRSPDDGAKPTSMESRQEHHAMENNESRKGRDVRAFQWLVDNLNGSNETHNFVLAMPGSFKQEWGREVWKGVVEDDRSTSQSDSQVKLHPDLSASEREGSTVYELCRCVRNFFYAYNNEGDLMHTEERRRLMRGCVETAASLVCCTRVELGLFGKVEKVLSRVLSKLGVEELTNNPLTIISNPMFTVRWTCLSLVAIWKMVDDKTLQGRAKFALDGIARLHTEYGVPNTKDLMAIAQRIDVYLVKAWTSVVDLQVAFHSEPGPWSLSRKPDVIRILKSHEASISELERIASEAVGVEDIDWRISFLQERMDEITHELMQRLPGVFFKKLKSPAPTMISEALDFPSIGNTPVPPQLIFPGQQIQSLCILGRRLRDIENDDSEENAESHEETLKSLESLRDIHVSSLPGLDQLMKRQLWRLLDLRDGHGFGFTVELFFLSLRQLELSSTSSELGLTKVFYTDTFEVITSDWEKSKDSAGTQRILLDILCDLVIRNRGVFSDSSYPPYIVDMLLDLVQRMVEGHGGSHDHINEVIKELEDDNLRNRMDNSLRDEALDAIDPSDTTPP